MRFDVEGRYQLARFVRTFVERDLPRQGTLTSPRTLADFWTMMKPMRFGVGGAKIATNRHKSPQWAHETIEMTRPRLAVDIGGTFTDVAVERDGSCLASKVLTTPDDPVRGVLDGVRLALARADLSPPDIGAVVHGTTLATNALIERTGATVGAIVTEGFRDILEIAYERRYDQYDLYIEKPDTLVPRERVATVPERIAADGQVLQPLDLESVHRAVDTLVAGGVDSLAVCLLHACANPAHEKAVRDIVASRHPALPISLSSEVSPEVREFDRLSTTVADASIKPLMEGYLKDLARSLREGGFDCPLYLMTSGGGMTTLATALAFPIRLVESGPSGGAILAAGVARSRRCAHALSFDMGGTTAKVCLIEHGEPRTSRAFEIARAERFIKGSGLPVRIPVTEMIEIGAGGGSIAERRRAGATACRTPQRRLRARARLLRARRRTTDGDRRRRGGRLSRPRRLCRRTPAARPRSARAAAPSSVTSEPASACRRDRTAPTAYRRSSTRPWPTPRACMPSSRARTLKTAHDDRLRRQRSPARHARGGQGRRQREIIIPPNPGAGSAVGFLSMLRCRSRWCAATTSGLSTSTRRRSTRCSKSMRREATAVVEAGAGGAPLTVTRTAFMRYRGQGHEIEVGVPRLRARRRRDRAPGRRLRGGLHPPVRSHRPRRGDRGDELVGAGLHDPRSPAARRRLHAARGARAYR